MKVDLLGRTPLVKPVPSPPSSDDPQRRLLRPPAGGSPLRATLVERADDPVADGVAAAPGVAVPDHRARRPAAAVPSETQPTPSRASTTPADAAAPVVRRPETWTGRPPGLLDEDVADNRDGLSSNPSNSGGHRRDVQSAEPSLEVGGYQVYYDLYSQTRLRQWMDAGIKELFIPLPGTRYLMVCPAQIAIERGSGKCRLLTPESPELASLGDAREVITMIQVYRRGELVWRGPGPYR